MPIGTQTVTDSFGRANETPLAGNWTQDSGASFNLSSNTVVGTTLANDKWAYYNAWSGGDDHYSQVALTEGSDVTGAGAGVCIRKATSATETMYRLVTNGSGAFELGKLIAGAFTSLRTGTFTYVAGQKVGLRVLGTTLQIWYNGVQVGTDLTDSGISTGAPGIAYSSVAPSFTLDDWDAGTTGTAAAAQGNFLAFM